MRDLNNKKSLLIMIVSVLILIIIGTSAAYSSFIGGEKTVSIETKDLNFNYNENSNTITLENPPPLTDEEGLENGGSFLFDISASSTKEQIVNYSIYLFEEENNTLDSNFVKIALLDNAANQLVPPIKFGELISLNGEMQNKSLYIDEFTLPADNNVKKEYVLKYWLDTEINDLIIQNNGNKQTATQSGGTFKFKVSVKTIK